MSNSKILERNASPTQKLGGYGKCITRTNCCILVKGKKNEATSSVRKSALITD